MKKDLSFKGCGLRIGAIFKDLKKFFTNRFQLNPWIKIFRL